MRDRINTEIYKRRAAALGLVVYAALLLTVERVVDMVHGPVGWRWLSSHLDRLDELLSTVEDACEKSDDRGFVARLTQATDHYTVVVDAVLDRVVGRPVR
ncbi:hypothetical protein OHA19_10475 [Streptomyces sp. NBC_00012]|uniref:hypothetical protein n=1 Tax=Streptomyces sp. NBC_00012 TaxID=2975621 RepID=UPI00324444B6